MIRKIEIENFFSVKERQTLDLTIAVNATDPDARFAEPVAGSKERIPRVVALFGANASGKTTLLKAITFLRDFVRGPLASGNKDAGRFLPFAGSGCNQKPSFFAVEFDWAYSSDEGRKVFRYELEMSPADGRVLREALYYWPSARRRTLFERMPEGIDAGPDFNLPKKDRVREKVGAEASVIATLSQFNHEWSTPLAEDLAHVLTNVSIFGKQPFAALPLPQRWWQYPDRLTALAHDLQLFDLGIEGVKLIETSQGKELYFVHKGLDGAIHFAFESQGTQSYCHIFPHLWSVLNMGGVAVLDEFDNDIHSLLLPEIVKKFQDSETNPKNAQLIISCHNATLLEYLTKEEVVLTEKDDQGQTRLYRLADVQGVRRNENIYGKYLMGAYGAVPRVA